MKIKSLTLGLILGIITVTLLPLNTALAGYGYNSASDGWGNKIQIWASYNPYGGNVKVTATALWVGITFFGIRLGTPIFYGEYISISVYGYSGPNLVYSTGLTSSTGWQFDKSWSFNLPGGLTAVNVYAYAKFNSIPFGRSSVSCTLYA